MMCFELTFISVVWLILLLHSLLTVEVSSSSPERSSQILGFYVTVCRCVVPSLGLDTSLSSDPILLHLNSLELTREA